MKREFLTQRRKDAESQDKLNFCFLFFIILCVLATSRLCVKFQNFNLPKLFRFSSGENKAGIFRLNPKLPF